MSNDSGSSFHAHLFQWSARASMIAFEMVIPAVIGIGLDRLFGTVVLFAILGTVFGMALGFWQLLKLALKESEIECSAVPRQTGVDNSSQTKDNNPNCKV